MILGIDIGSTYTKSVWLDNNKNIIDNEINKTTVLPEKLIGNLIEKKQVKYIAATGYGRHLLKKNKTTSIITEIKAHALAAFNEFDNPSFVIDIGGQDSKVIQLNKDGSFGDFLMNDKCAAGTGKFLEIAAAKLGISLKEMDKLAFKATSPCKITSMCAVFAESEIISLITKGETVDNLSAGILDSVATRVTTMAKKLGAKNKIVFSGGGAKSEYLKSVLENKLNAKILIPKYPQFMGAIGATLSFK